MKYLALLTGLLLIMASGCSFFRDTLVEMSQEDVKNAEAVREAIIQAITLWEPRITVEQLEVSNSIDEDSLNPDDLMDDTQHILSVRIRFFDPENILEVQELVLELPLSGG